MASRFFGLNRGQDEMNPDAVTSAASTQSTDVELRVDTGKGLTRHEVVRITEALLRHVADGRSTDFIGV